MSTMTIEDLRALCKPGKCPSKVNLRHIEDYICRIQREAWLKSNHTSLSEITPLVLKELGIFDEVVISYRNIPGFLMNPAKVVVVYHNQNEESPCSIFDISCVGEEYFKQEAIFDSETGKYFHKELCSVAWHTVNSKTLQISKKESLKWNAPELCDCSNCGLTFSKSELVFNELQDDIVDLSCDSAINKYKNEHPETNNPIAPYHSHRSTWKFFPQKKGKERSIPMGIELEMHNKFDNSETGAKLAAKSILIALKEETPQYYFEWDGSLSPGGFEMVANPMTLEFGNEWWSKSLPIIRKFCVGYGVEKLLKKNNNELDVTGLDYGIHITVPRKFVPDSVIAKISRFFDQKENYEFISAIAQRSKLYGGYVLGQASIAKASSQLGWEKGKQGKMASKDRRQPINIKKGLIEFRMFRSTLNQVSFLKNMEFIDALTSYFKEEMGQSVSHVCFINWLIKNQKRYPNLILYLKHPLFFVKGIGPIKNVWSTLVKVKTSKINIDPLKEYGPKPLYLDDTDKDETSMMENA